MTNLVYAQENAGIDCDVTKLTNGTCNMDAYKTLKIREWSNNEPDNFVQDAILGATFFIGTMSTIWLVVSAMFLIMAWADQEKANRWKKWIKLSIIWLLVVLFSYVIIRIIQTISQW